MRALLLFAEDGIGAIEGWFRIAEGQVVARGAGQIPLPDEGEDLLLVLAGSEVALRWLDMPALTEPQAAAAARITLADCSLGPVDALHVAVGPDENGRRLVATIARGVLDAWLAWARGIGLEPDHVVPLQLLMAPGDGPVRLWQRPGRTLVRGATLAFAIEPDLAAAALGDEPTMVMDDAAFADELPAMLATLPLDLRQGPYRRRREWRAGADWRKRMIRYAIAALILLALIPVARLGRIAYDGYRMRAEAAELARQVLGLPERPGNPRAALQARLDRMNGPGMGFVEGSAILFGAVRQTPNVELTTMTFDESGWISADVASTSPADLAELMRRIGASGLLVDMSRGNGPGSGNIRIRQP